MSWLKSIADRLSGRGADEGASPTGIPAPPTGTDIVAAVDRVQEDIERADVPAAVSARVARIVVTVHEMEPRLDRLGIGSTQAHSVVATATSYLPEAVAGYLRLPREFADRRAVHQGKTSLMVLCDQLDLLGVTLEKVSDAVSRADANALVAHGAFLAEKFRRSSSLRLDPPPAGGPTVSGAP